MKTEIIETSAVEREIKIEIEAETVKAAYQKICQKYAKGAQIPGFRKGFAPVDVVKTRFKSEIQNETLQELLAKWVTQAIQESGLHPLSEPQLHLEDAENVKLNGSQSLNLHVHFEVMPEIPTPEYKNLEAVRRIKPIAEGETEMLIQERLQEGATLVPVEDRASEKGDSLLVDLEGIFVDSPDEPPITAADLEINLGDELIEESFTNNLIGVKEDDEKSFTVVYPEDFTSPVLAGKTVNYKAKIKSVGKLEMPELDDEWAQSLDEGYETLAELRGKLAGELETMAKADADARVRNDLIAKVIENHEFEVPNALVENQSRNLMNNFAMDMQQRGVDLKSVGEDFVQMIYEQTRTQAVRDIRGAMLLEKIAELEKIEVTPEEIAAEVEQMATYYRATPEQIRKSLEEQGGDANIAHSLRNRKAVEAIVSNANVTDGEWIDETIAPQIETVEEETVKEETPKAELKPKKKAAKKEAK